MLTYEFETALFCLRKKNKLQKYNKLNKESKILN